MKVYRFRVLLVDKSEALRDIEIRSDQSFEEFHQAILDAFDFKGQEMASFYLSDEEWGHGREIPLADLGIEEDGAPAPTVMKDMLISDTIRSTQQRYIYIYDFLNMWNFMVELVAASEPDEHVEYPRCVITVNTPPSEFSRVDDLLKAEGEEDPFGFEDEGSSDEDDFDDHQSIDDLGDEYL